MAGSHRLRRADRLLRTREFRQVGREGRRTVGRYFVVVVAPGARSDGRSCSRLGVTVSRRVGGAVVRNRLKRHMRDWFRHSRRQLPLRSDIVVIARRGAGDLSGREVASRLTELAGRAGGEDPR